MQGEAAACTVGGLRAGCTYRVRVRARNAAGHSSYSAPADVKTAADTPEPPSAPAAVSRGTDTLTVAWEAPSHDGGSPIMSYRLELCRGGLSAACLSQTDIVFGLYLIRTWTSLPVKAFPLNALDVTLQEDSGHTEISYAL